MKRKIIFILTVICTLTAMAKVTPEVSTQDYDVAAFTSVIVNGPFDVTFSQGATQQVSITSDHLELIDVRSIDGKLVLSLKSQKNTNIRTLKAVITAPSINAITVTNAATWNTAGVLQTSELSLVSNNASTLTVNAICTNMNVQSKEASTLILQGKADNLTLSATGASTCNTADLQTINATITASGASSVSVNAQTLSMEAHSASTIRYMGEPTITHSVAKGASTIRKK